MTKGKKRKEENTNTTDSVVFAGFGGTTGTIIVIVPRGFHQHPKVEPGCVFVARIRFPCASYCKSF